MAFYYAQTVYTPATVVTTPVMVAAATPYYGQVELAAWANLDATYVSPTHQAWGRYKATDAYPATPAVPAVLCTPVWYAPAPPTPRSPGAKPDQGWRFWQLKH